MCRAIPRIATFSESENEVGGMIGVGDATGADEGSSGEGSLDPLGAGVDKNNGLTEDLT